MKKLIIFFAFILSGQCCFASFEVNDSKTNADSVEMAYKVLVDILNSYSYDSQLAYNRSLDLKNKIERADVFDADKYLTAINTIADYYIRNQQYGKAEQILSEAMKAVTIRKKTDTPNMRSFLVTVGGFRLRIGDIDNAKKYLSQAKYDIEKAKETNTLNYAQCLSNLAMANQYSGDYVYADILFNGARDVFNAFKEANLYPVYAESSLMMVNNNLAANYFQMGDKEKAKEWWHYSIEGCERANRTDDFLVYLLACINYGSVALSQGNYTDAVNTMSKVFFKNIPYFDYKDVLFQNMLLSLYFLKDNRLTDYLRQYNDFIKLNTANVFSTYSEADRENYWTTQSRLLLVLNNMVTSKNQTSELLDSTYNTTLYTKNLLMRFNVLMSDFIKSSHNDEFKKQYLEILKYRTKINDKQTSDSLIQKYKELVDQKEHTLVRNIPHFGKLLFSGMMTINDIKNRLLDHEVSVEFTLIPELSSVTNVKMNYGALILRKGYNAPMMIKLCNKDSLENVVITDELTDDYINNLYAQGNNTLYNMIFRQLEPYLKTGDVVYYSPSGYLNNINFMAIPHGDKRMMDLYTFKEVSSTANIWNVKTSYANDKYSTASVYGGIDYSEDVSEMSREADKYTQCSSTNFVASRSLSDRGTWDAIPGSHDEALAIDNILSSHQVKTSLMEGSAANEESFKKLSGNSPDIIHLATHGFFLSSPDDSKSSYFKGLNSYVSKDVSMQLSGVLLAGANNAWVGNEIPHGVEDGILTADEISRLDLRNTKIAVLSACDTGLGDIDEVNGVFGLQRGLKMAGVKTIIMSLWKVPDVETSLMMTNFYRLLFSGVDRYRAFNEAVNIVRTKCPQPYYWAGFVMLD